MNSRIWRSEGKGTEMSMMLPLDDRAMRMFVNFNMGCYSVNRESALKRIATGGKRND